MNEIEDLMADWKKVTRNSPTENSALIKQLNKSVMNTIINYEKEEIEDKRRMKLTGLFGLVIFMVALVPQVLLGNMIFKTSNLAGFFILFCLIVLSIILNRTDNFPDARTLPVRQYLEQVRDKILKRKRMHITNSIMGLALYIPAVYFAFNDLYAPDFVLADVLNLVMKIAMGIVIVLVLHNAFKWSKKYDERILPVRKEVEQMINELD